MGSCIICNAAVDGYVCDVHEEDVVFEFEGTRPDQLGTGRYYHGTVDGYADFGVFVDIGDHVTGLLHRSELDRRLESLDWEPGDEVFVQVLSLRDNGNVDLGWSIRQREREFRGTVVDTGDGQRLPDDSSDPADDDATPADDSPDPADDDATPADDSPDPADDDATSADDSPEPVNDDATPADDSPDPADDDATPAVDRDRSDGDTVADPIPAGDTPVADPATSGGTTAAPASTGTADVEEIPDREAETVLERTTVDAIDAQTGSVVRLEGEISSVRQTSGPTVFGLKDETGTVDCAAFEEAGVRAYPSVDTGDVVTIEGEVERHYGDLQIETETLTVLEGEEETAVADRLEAAIEAQATPDRVALLAADDAVEAVEDALVEAATSIRRAVAETRPIVVRHGATADGYVAGAAIERAVLPLIREKHTRDDAEYHYVKRRPLDGRVYDMDAATDDVTAMLNARDRHGEQSPLVVLVGVGATAESTDGYDLLSLYDADAIVIDDSHAEAAIEDAVSQVLAPSLAGADVETLTATTLAANVAAHVNDDVRDDLEHLPAVSYWEETPEAYRQLAREAGYDETAITERREAVALEAYYQSYKDKRELVTDLLFTDGDGSDSAGDDLAAHVSGQFRDKLDAELETARRNRTEETVDGVTVWLLDTDQFTHRYDFPTTDLLLDALQREGSEATDGPFVTIGLDTAELRLRASEPVDVGAVGDAIADAVPEGGVRTVGGHDGYVEFLAGERAAVEAAALDAVGETLA